jgi:hypothetical protein
MLATFGLERLETGLNRGTVSATDVAEFLQQAEAVDVDTLARDGMSRALDHQHRRLHGRVTTDARRTSDSDAPGLPIRLYAYREVNPEFQPTPHANRV